MRKSIAKCVEGLCGVVLCELSASTFLHVCFTQNAQNSKQVIEF